MTKIYIQLLDEGTTVYRPTTGLPVAENVFTVIATSNYEKSEEVWEFIPGSTVICEREFKGGEHILIAKRYYKEDYKS